MFLYYKQESNYYTKEKGKYVNERVAIYLPYAE